MIMDFFVKGLLHSLYVVGLLTGLGGVIVILIAIVACIGLVLEERELNNHD